MTLLLYVSHLQESILSGINTTPSSVLRINIAKQLARVYPATDNAHRYADGT
jgi:hypothetical protein